MTCFCIWIEWIFKIGFLAYALLSFNSLCYGRVIISLVLWPTLLVGGFVLVMRVMKYSRDSGISPALFMDVIIYNCHEEIVIDIDWEKFLILINRTLPDNMLMITIYLDLEYVNNSIDVIDELYKNRYTVDDTV